MTHADKAVIYENQMEINEVYKTGEKNRSRMEYRTIQMCQNTEMITLCKTQNEIQTVAWLEQVELLSSRKMSAQEMLTLKRNHWRIENSLHHVLDELFHEDRSAARNSKNNMAVLRKLAYNILKLAIMAKKTRVRIN